MYHCLFTSINNLIIYDVIQIIDKIILFEQQVLNVDNWIVIPSNKVIFPALLNTNIPLSLNLESKLHLLVEANYRKLNIDQNIKKCTVS